jgi:hypothetical protein
MTTIDPNQALLNAEGNNPWHFWAKKAFAFKQ